MSKNVYNSDIVDKKTNDDDYIVDPNTLQINTTAKPQKQVRTRGGRVAFLSARSNNNQKHIRTRGGKTAKTISFHFEFLSQSFIKKIS